MTGLAQWRGVYGAVMGRENWETQFDLSRKGLQKSFYAILLLFPAFYICSYAVQKARAEALEQLVVTLPGGRFVALTTVLIFSFSISAYVIAMIVDKQDLVVVPALAFALSIIGLLPLNAAFYLAMIAYLFSLVVDIRIIQEVLNYDLGKSVLLACLLTAITLMILTAGLSQIA